MDRKMASAGDILAGMNLRPNAISESSGRTSDWTNRREIVRRCLTSFYLSCRREQPEAEMLDIEIDLAMQDWEEIPTGRIVEVAAEARKQAGEFMPTNGLMAKIWRERLGDKREEALKAIRTASTAFYLAPPAEAPTAEQRAENARLAAEIARKLAGEA
jgi:hypothetical protein